MTKGLQTEELPLLQQHTLCRVSTVITRESVLDPSNDVKPDSLTGWTSEQPEHSTRPVVLRLRTIAVRDPVVRNFTNTGGGGHRL